MNDFISHTSWMRNVPDDAPLTTLSIPGTHNSCCVDGPLGFAKTQNLDLADQLRAGIRLLNIRLTHYRDNLCVHHDMVCTEKSYADVLIICSDFLRQYPSETILMPVKDEDCFDSALSKLAPSQIFCKLPVGGTVNGNTRSFEETFRARTWEHIGDALLFYNFTPGPPGSDPVATPPVFTSEKRLEQLRGKVVLLRRFEGSQGVGLDLTYWSENQRFRSAAPPFYDVEDRYQDPGDGEKYEFVVAHVEDAVDGDSGDLYITFSNTVDLTTRSYSTVINPRLGNYLSGSQKWRVGIIVMDYFEEPRQLVSNVIEMDYRKVWIS